jgi:cytidylate kinase
MIITIDGPAGTGKTTVARRVAECLHFPCFDTGAMYRMVSWIILEEKIDLSDLPRLESLLENFVFDCRGEGKDKRYFVGERDVTEEIRSQKVNAIVSAVSALGPVRSALRKIQRAFGQRGNVVFEGRDMGSVVFPDADIKVFLSARPEIRARRRLDEMLAKNPEEAETLDQDQMLADILQRDALDSSRTLAPLKCPEGAYQVDTSDLSIDEVVDLILKYKMEKFP